MIVEIHDQHTHGQWRVELSVSNYRRNRWLVSVETDGPDSTIEGGCVGFADDEAAGRSLFEAVSRAVALATGADVEPVDWAEIPESQVII